MRKRTKLEAEIMAILDNFAESNVTVNKNALLEAIRGNRETHKSTFLRAQDGYRTAVVEELDMMLREAREGRRIRRSIALVEPQDHTKDYDRVVKMLEMSTADTINISERQFGQYVLDEWGWSEAFNTSTQPYTGDARRNR